MDLVAYIFLFGTLMGCLLYLVATFIIFVIDTMRYRKALKNTDKSPEVAFGHYKAKEEDMPVLKALKDISENPPERSYYDPATEKEFIAPFPKVPQFHSNVKNLLDAAKVPNISDFNTIPGPVTVDTVLGFFRETSKDMEEYHQKENLNGGSSSIPLETMIKEEYPEPAKNDYEVWMYQGTHDNREGFLYLFDGIQMYHPQFMDPLGNWNNEKLLSDNWTYIGDL